MTGHLLRSDVVSSEIGRARHEKGRYREQQARKSLKLEIDYGAKGIKWTSV